MDGTLFSRASQNKINPHVSQSPFVGLTLGLTPSMPFDCRCASRIEYVRVVVVLAGREFECVTCGANLGNQVPVKYASHCLGLCTCTFFGLRLRHRQRQEGAAGL